MGKLKKIIAIHGAGMGPAIWSALADCDMPLQFETVTLPGHGDGASPCVTIAEMAKWLKTQLDAEEQASIVLAGHSMGALVALASCAHSAIGACVFMGAGLSMPVNADLLETARTAPDTAKKLIAQWSVFKSAPSAEILREQTLSVMAGVDADALFIDLSACNDYADGLETARQTGKPALIIAGDSDKMAKPQSAMEMAEFFPFAEFALLASCGHMMMIEKPAETAVELTRFIGRLQAG